MDLKDGDLHIWRYSLNGQDYRTEKESPVLSKEEQNRYNAYINESDKIRYIGNHRFVRQVLSKYLNILPAQVQFSQTAMGKPYVENSGLFFNYSYRGDFGILALSRNEEVGVDIEKMRILQDIPTFTEFCFSEKEKQIIFKSDKEKFQETLFIFWTFKEAIIKSLGVGLNVDISEIDLSDFFYKELNALAYDGGNAYTIKNIDAPQGFMAAFAMKGKVSNYTEFNYSERLFFQG